MNESIHITANNFNLNEKIICVTGGNGFIGKKLIEELSKIKCRIKMLTRKKDSKFPNNVEIFIGDLSNGMYFGRFTTYGNLVEIKKLIIKR